ncbi:hypothetical protein GW17_00048225, partial [Ensete ventricosum]
DGRDGDDGWVDDDGRDGDDGWVDDDGRDGDDGWLADDGGDGDGSFRGLGSRRRTVATGKRERGGGNGEHEDEKES